MTRKERLQAQLESRQKRDQERRDKTRQLKEELAKAAQDERRVRLSLIGRLAEEAGLMDWDNDTLLRAFQDVCRKGPLHYPAEPLRMIPAAD